MGKMKPVWMICSSILLLLSYEATSSANEVIRTLSDTFSYSEPLETNRPYAPEIIPFDVVSFQHTPLSTNDGNDLPITHISNTYQENNFKDTSTQHDYSHVTLPPHDYSYVTPASHGFSYVTPAPHAYSTYNHKPEPKGCTGYEECVPIVTCAPFYSEVRDKPDANCVLYNGATGICCPPRKDKGKPRQLFHQPDLIVPIDIPITSYQIDLAISIAGLEMEERERMSQYLQMMNMTVTDRRRPEFSHLQFFKTSPQAIALNEDAHNIAETAAYLVNKFNLTPEQAAFGLSPFLVGNNSISNSCPAIPTCNDVQQINYRTIDGRCNNLNNPSWGQARTSFQRIVLPTYSDGLRSPRTSRLGGTLPSARVVSTRTVIDTDRPSLDLTLSVMQWGQFIDHDITHTPIERFANMTGIECCTGGTEENDIAPPNFLHSACFPIEIPADDPFFSQFNHRCMNFVRSMRAPRLGCPLGYVEQMNQITHYLDSSNIYGSSEDEENHLRERVEGLLVVQERAQVTQQREILPADPEAIECDLEPSSGFACFRAGDNRVNEQIDLAVMHTVWVREHNRLARELFRLNPDWTDDTIYHETRRIVNAEYQHIIYNEYLPHLLGVDYMEANGLLPRREGFSRDYDSNLNAAMFNEFATVAYRFGHTLVQGMIELFGHKNVPSETVLLHNHYNNPRLIYTPGKLDEFLRGLATQPVQQTDNFITESLTNRLFQGRATPIGLDLVALNIQRGREHGVGTYNDLRAACGLPRATRFEDLLDVLPEQTVNQFRSLYASVDDIDPFIAGISERQDIEDSVLGPTFRCIVSDQFTRLKRGDRFFYDFGDMSTSFTEGQLNEIRKASWARILCDNGDHIKYMQPLAFYQPEGLNQRVLCEGNAIPKIDLTPWDLSA